MRPGYRALASALAVVGLVAGVILWRAGEREFHLNTDETQHAVTGLFVADFLRDLPLTEPRAYAFRYYAQYPALGLVHWPPMFYLAEGLMFRLCGASAWTARITICLFAVLGLVYWMRLVAALDGPLTATLSGLILGWLPYMLLYEKAVMLEIPSLALCIACSYYWYRYLEGSSWSLIGVACLSTLAILTKQQSLYLAPFFLATVWAQRRWRDLFSPAGLIAVGIPLLPVVAFYAYSYAVHGPTIRALVGQPLQGQGNPLLFYPRALPEQLGWPLLALAALGLATARWWARRKALLFMLIWIAASFVAALAFAVKESRYTIYWIPPLVYLAVAPLCAAYRQRGVRLAARAAAVLLVALAARNALAQRQPFIAGYAAAARRVTGSGESGIVLFDGGLPGNFIFYMRASDPARRFIVLRKALWVTNTQPEYGSKQLVSGPDEIRELLRAYGIKYIVVEQGGPLNFEVQTTLRELLRTAQFRELEEFPVSSNVPGWERAHLDLYENLEAQARTEQVLTVPMLTLGQDIRVPIAAILKD